MTIGKEEILALRRSLQNKTVGIAGDFCVDIYWEADMTRSELSRETPHFPLPVTAERVYPGAGGNVAANLAALQPKKVAALTLAGDDWRGMLLKEKLRALKIDDALLVTVPGRFTNAYCKPIRHGISAVAYEDPRLDFDNFTPVDETVEAKIIENLTALASESDVLCVADQFRFGCITPAVREALREIAKQIPVIADSRYHIADFTGCILKPNEVECWRAVYGDDGFLTASAEQFRSAAITLARRNSATVFCTLGAEGSVLTDGVSVYDTPAVPVSGPVDICGAGDTSLAAFACALAAGEEPAKAAAFAAYASAVTVQKLGVTGTACFEEILRLVCGEQAPALRA